MKADFHIHTSLSDGSDSSETVFKMASEAGIDMISVTDHDTLRGRHVHQINANKYNIKYIPGVEVSAYDYARKRPVHIIGINIKEDSPQLNEMIRTTLETRNEISLKRIDLLKEKGYKIDLSEFEDRFEIGIYKQHIMQNLIKKGYAKDLYGKFYKTHFKNGGFLDLTIDYPCHKKAVEALVEAGGIAILAHPCLYQSLEAVKELVDVGLGGLEYKYPSATSSSQKKIKDLAQNYGLILTGGSDYHGKNADKSGGNIGAHYFDCEEDFFNVSYT